MSPQDLLSGSLIDTLVAFAAVMLAASLVVNAVVRLIENLGRYRSRALEGMLKSVLHGFRSFNNDPEVLKVDLPAADPAYARIKPEIPGIQRVLDAAGQRFADDIREDPTLHARGQQIPYGSSAEQLAKLVNYIEEQDLIDIANNHAEYEAQRQSAEDQLGGAHSAPPGAAPSEAPPPSATLPSTAMPERPLPASWFVAPNSGKAVPAYATTKHFDAYVKRFFKTFEATTTEMFRAQMRRLTLVVSCIVVVLANLDGIHLIRVLRADDSADGPTAALNRNVAELQTVARRLNVEGTALREDEQLDTSSRELALEIQKSASVLDDPNLGFGWQDSWIVKRWCAYRGRCEEPAISGSALARDTLVWVIGLVFSCILVSFGQSVWYKVIENLLGLKSKPLKIAAVPPPARSP